MKMKPLSFLIVAGLSLLMPSLQSCSVDDDDVFDASTDPTVCPEPMRFSFKSTTEMFNFKDRLVNVKLKDIYSWANQNMSTNWVRERTKTLRNVS